MTCTCWPLGKVSARREYRAGMIQPMCPVGSVAFRAIKSALRFGTVRSSWRADSNCGMLCALSNSSSAAASQVAPVPAHRTLSPRVPIRATTGPLLVHARSNGTAFPPADGDRLVGPRQRMPRAILEVRVPLERFDVVERRGAFGVRERPRHLIVVTDQESARVRPATSLRRRSLG